jgi:RNA polymerase sigma-70 factor (ECF subfamily)
MDRTELIRTYQSLGPTLVLYARTWLDEAAAQDAVQDAFVALAARGGGVTSPRAWIYAAVRNRAIELARSGRRRDRRDRRVGGAEAFHADAAALIEGGALTAALDGLGVEEREVVTLRVWGGMSFEEVGALTGVSAATAFRRYRAALGAIRKKLEGTCTRPKS